MLQLNSKTGRLFLLGFVGVILFLGFIIRASYLQGYEELDHKDVKENATRVVKTFLENFNTLDSKVGDWSAWDEAYNFVQGNSNEFAKTDITDTVVDAMKLDMLAFLDHNLDPKAVKIWGLQSADNRTLVDGTVAEFPFLAKDSELIARSSEKSAFAIVDFKGEPALAVSKYVSKSDGSGVYLGRVIFARKIPGQLLNTLREQTLYEVAFIKNRDAHPSDQSDSEGFSYGELDFHKDVAFGYYNILDAHKKSLGYLKITLPRNIAQFGKQSARVLMGILTITLIAILAGLLYVIRSSSLKRAVTEILKAHDFLLKRESYLNALLDSIPGYVSWFDSSLNYLGVNQKLAADFNAQASDFIGKPIGFKSHEAKPQLKKILEDFFQSQDNFLQTTMFIKAGATHDSEDSKHMRKMLICLEKYNNPSSRSKDIRDTSVVVVGIDITDAWRLEEQAAKDRHLAIQSSRLSSLGEMAAGIAHEINNPLTIIQAGCYKLSKKLKQENLFDQYKDMIALIENTTVRIGKIVSGLRSFSRDGSKDPLAPYSVHKLIEETITLCGERFKNHGITLEKILPIEDRELSCRPSQIGQVLVNLINNAYDAITTLSEQWVRIEVQYLDQDIEISVTDSGLGIPKDIVNKLMDPFFTTKPVGKGTGLGLSISHGIIKDHHGRLFYDEQSPRTRFVVKIPVTTASIQQQKEAA